MCKNCYVAPHYPELRRVCDPNERVADDEHKHRCKGCGTVWCHSEALKSNPGITVQDFREAHRCPHCGREERFIFEHARKREDSRIDRILEMIFGPEDADA